MRAPGAASSGPGTTTERPLDERGHAQAEALVPVLADYHLHRAYSAPVVRCLETIAPFARASGLPVHQEPLLAEEGAAKDADGAVEWLVGIAALPESSIVCTQRGTLTAVFPDLMRRLGYPTEEVPRLGKGRVLVLHLAGPDQLASVDRLPRPF